MTPPALAIYCDYAFPEPAAALLREGTRGHRLVLARAPTASHRGNAPPDAALDAGEVALGQPAPEALGACARLRWLHLASAGYERYDRPEVRAALQQRGIALTTSSHVYAEPCAEHVLAMILALARRLPDAWEA